jgi:hypothetical protein
MSLLFYHKYVFYLDYYEEVCRSANNEKQFGMI